MLGAALAQIDGAVQRLPDRLTVAACPAVLTGTALAFAEAAACGLILLARRQASLRSQLSFGPFLLAGALLALAAAR